MGIVPEFAALLPLIAARFQNKILLEEVSERLSKKCYKVLMQSRVPANDGGLALGQAVIATAVRMQTHTSSEGI